MHQHLAGVGLLDEIVQHLFGDLEVGDHPVLHGLDGHDVARGAAQHLLGFLAHRLHLARVFVDGHDGGLVDHDALARRIYQRVGGSQVDCQVTGKHAEQRTQVSETHVVGTGCPQLSLQTSAADGTCEHGFVQKQEAQVRAPQ